MKRAYLKTLWFVLAVGVIVGGTAAFAQTGANVTLDRMMNADKAKYRVEGAVGETQAKAVETAKLAALEFAASTLTGDPNQKSNAVRYVQHNFDKLKGFASKGRIYRRGFDESGEKMSLSVFIYVDMAAFKRSLVEAGVITSSRAIAKGVGKPSILVFYSQGDCDKGNKNAPICALPKQIKEASKEVEKAENRVMEFQKALVKAGCFVATQSTVESSRNYKDKTQMSGSHSHAGSGGGSGHYVEGLYHAAGGGVHHYRSRSRGNVRVHFNRELAYKFSSKYIRASDNCRKFMSQVAPMMDQLRRAVNRRNRLQDQLDRARSQLMQNDVTTFRINEWLVNQRWNVVDAEAVKKAQRRLDAMTSVEGLPQDPVAAIALMAGADIYIEHDFVVTHPNGGYCVNVTIKAYDVISGKLLASKVGRSTPLASPDKQAALREAVGRAMPKVLEQIQGYWADMAREGVKARIVLKGDFSDSDLSDTIEGLISDDLPDAMGRYCGNDNCEWEGKLSTKHTIMGDFRMPVKAKKRKVYARKLRKLLRNEGLSVSKIVDQPGLQIMEIQN